MFLQHENLQINPTYALPLTDLVSWLSLLHLISTSFAFLVSGLYMHYHNFHCTFSCYLLPKTLISAVVILAQVVQETEWHDSHSCDRLTKIWL
jgi:hypothetical protein